MSVPPRPEHVVSRYQELQRRLELVRDRVRIRRQSRLAQRNSGDPAGLSAGYVPSESDDGAPTIPSMIPGLLIGAAVALLGLGVMWGWQTWSGRVSEPIEDRVPMLVSMEQGASGTPDSSSASEVQEDVASGASVATDDAGSTDSQTPLAGAGERVEPAHVVVHVSGAVVLPGVVELSSGARIIDALEAAGGAAIDADLDRVNLAAVVMDGERIHVPAEGEDAPPVVVAPSRSGDTSFASGGGGSDAPPPLLDINGATAEALEALPGVGPSTAQAIVQTRVNRGPFLTVDELLDVPGIGEAKLAQIEPYVLVGR